MHLLDCDPSPIQSPWRTYPFHVEEKVLMLHGGEFRSHLGMATNTPSSVYKPLHEYGILRVSNSPHLCEFCITLSVVTQHLPLRTMPASLSDSFPYILMSVSPKRLRVLAVLHTAQLGPPRLYGECFCVCLSHSDTTLSRA
ncbi:hypothetical protein GW17_00014738 [Ensete ventricosum]|nr:hypothetical protein GW17_00014738 [Ensete ventricosum]